MIKIQDLRCEYATSPISIDTPHPRLSWVLSSDERAQSQSAYRIFAATSMEKLTSAEYDLWDSGKILSPNQLVSYAGHSLQSRDQVYWQVQVWDKNGQNLTSSEPAVFEIGLLQRKDWEAKWAGFPAGWNGQGLYYRKVFQVEKEVRWARVYVSGLGTYELYINGNKISDSVLAPAWSTYAKTVYYNIYNIDQAINTGANVVGIIAGNGWYGTPILLLQLEVEYEDGNHAILCKSGTDWQVTHGPILANSIYDGETYDARLELTGWHTVDYPQEYLSSWAGSMMVDGPSGKLVPETAPPVRVTERLSPVNISQPQLNVYVFDMGQNFAGWVRLRVKGTRGDKITLKFAESLYPDGIVNQENLRAAAATDIYILNGEGIEQWEPRFTYHGFRYVQVEGLHEKPKQDTIEGCVVRSGNQPTGIFTCSSELLNAIHKMVCWTEVSNEPSIPTDCPQRDERMGWLNDMAARSEQIVYNFDVARFLAKWISDIADTQDPATGSITDTAPFRWGHRPADPVSVCYLLIPWLLYLHYDDKRTMDTHYSGMKAWVDFLHQQAENDILTYSYWGDWSPPVSESLHGSIGSSAVSRNTPGTLMSTGMSYYATNLLSLIAKVLGKEEDAALYEHNAKCIANAYHNRFFNSESGGYSSNNQACNAFTLYLDIVPKDSRIHVRENLVRDVVEKHNGHLTTGNLCTKYLLEALTDAGRSDIAYLIASQRTYPSWGYMLENGATTLWERWEQATGGGMNSHNHPMMGSIDSWFYRALGGLQTTPSGPGFRIFRVKPQLITDLQYVDVKLATIRGNIRSAWTRKGQAVIFTVQVPVGSTAWVSIPVNGTEMLITESNQVVWGPEAVNVKGIENVEDGTNTVDFTVNSGTYIFVRKPR